MVRLVLNYAALLMVCYTGETAVLKIWPYQVLFYFAMLSSTVFYLIILLSIIYAMFYPFTAVYSS
jgi:hypothetical protein